MKRYLLRVSHGEPADPEQHDFDSLEEMMPVLKQKRTQGLLCMPLDRETDQLLVIPDDPNQLDLFL